MEPDKIFQVSEFNEFINLYLEGVGEVVIEGEISQVNISKRIFLFATIKDKESSVEVFGITHQLSGYDLLEEGMLVHVYGSPNLYKKSGRFSIKANRIVPAGEGALKLAFDKLKNKLSAEGLFDQSRKRPLPKYPQKIGLLTAKDSRAYGDFIKVLKNRLGGIQVIFVPVNVQGKDSVNTIIAGIRTLNKRYPNLDFIVLTRGGGSLEDLQSFNDERVAREIFSSNIPIVSAIGHEDDVSISDMVADLRASTPSNAAEITIPNKTVLITKINHTIEYIESSVAREITRKKNTLYSCVNSLNTFLNEKIFSFKKIIQKFSMNFVSYKNNISARKVGIKTSINIISNNIKYRHAELINYLESMTRLLNSLSFDNVLKRGFSITYDISGNIISSVDALDKGQEITTKFYKGKFKSVVTDK